MADDDLLRIGELAKAAGVPIATLKHYLRERLIEPARKTGRTMSWYAPSTVAKVKVIKALQQEHFLPLDVIRESLAGGGAAVDDLSAAAAIARVLEKHTGPKSRSRDELIARGVSPQDLDWLGAAGLARAGKDGRYRGDDLALLATLGAARKAGITPAMLPFSILGEYVAALQRLVEIELSLFRDGVLARAKRDDVPALTTAATELSERLVVLVRRKLLLPTLISPKDPKTSKEKPHAKPARKPRAR
ncbi:MAG: MerR family transcriptional regulator [Deltaproteobacteria bacterium]|nr:MerR family transcriptional regulator [Deltaproteobacteria bacterium]